MTKETGSLKASLQIILFCLAQEDRWLTGGQRPGGPWGGEGGRGQRELWRPSCARELTVPSRRLPCREPAKR